MGQVATERLSPHFAVEEFAVSASFPDLVRPVPDLFLPNVRLLARLLEEVREVTGPMRILSGYRSSALNHAVGGSPTSQHRQAAAVDVTSDDHRHIFQTTLRIGPRLPGIGQVIYYPAQGFMHLALASQRFPVFTPCVHRPPRFRYLVIPRGDAGIDWLRDNVR